MTPHHFDMAKNGERGHRVVPATARMLASIGRKVRQLRGKHSQEWLESASGVTRKIISEIELSKRDYQITSLLRVLSVLQEDDNQLFAASLNPAHQELHRKLQELLDAGDQWETAATTNIDGVYDYFKKKTE